MTNRSLGDEPDDLRRIVATLKLIEHHLAKMGQGGMLLVTHTLNLTTTAAASAAPAVYFKRASRQEYFWIYAKSPSRSLTPDRD